MHGVCSYTTCGVCGRVSKFHCSVEQTGYIIPTLRFSVSREYYVIPMYIHILHKHEKVQVPTLNDGLDIGLNEVLCNLLALYEVLHGHCSLYLNTLILATECALMRKRRVEI